MDWAANSRLNRISERRIVDGPRNSAETRGGSGGALVAYDGAQFYRIFGCALDGLRHGRLDAAMLRTSKTRLDSAFPIAQGRTAAHVIGLADQSFKN